MGPETLLVIAFASMCGALVGWSFLFGGKGSLELGRRALLDGLRQLPGLQVESVDTDLDRYAVRGTLGPHAVGVTFLDSGNGPKGSGPRRSRVTTHWTFDMAAVDVPSALTLHLPLEDKADLVGLSAHVALHPRFTAALRDLRLVDVAVDLRERHLVVTGHTGGHVTRLRGLDVKQRLDTLAALADATAAAARDPTRRRRCPVCRAQPILPAGDAAFSEACGSCGGRLLPPASTERLLAARFRTTAPDVKERAAPRSDPAACPACATRLSDVGLEDTAALLCTGCGSLWLDRDAWATVAAEIALFR